MKRPMLWLWLCLWMAGLNAWAGEVARLRVEAAYIDLHTGPGPRFPRHQVAERGEWIEVLKGRTGWYKVRTERGATGWVSAETLVQATRTAEGRHPVTGVAKLGDFSHRRWEFGVGGGDFGGAALISGYAGFAMTRNLSAEVSLAHVLGRYSDSLMVNADLVAQPFPSWRVSPFFALGTGIIRTLPHATLIQAEDRTDPAGHGGFGVRWYLSGRFMLRAEFRRYVIFTSRDDNEDIDEWKAGLSFFY